MAGLWDDERVRVRLLLVLFGLSLVLLLAAVWRLQVAHGSRYQQSLTKQSVRRVRVAGIRGRILDCHGASLADNRPSYAVALYLEELRRPGRWSRTIASVEEQLAGLAARLRQPPAITRDDIENHIRRRLPLPLLAWRDISPVTQARFAEQTGLLPGVDIVTESLREYPQHRLAAHLLGYVGRAEPAQDEEEPYHYFLPEITGKTGLEQSLDAYLRGQPGCRLVRVDVSGFRHDDRQDLGGRPARRGNDVVLTLDARVQRAAELALAGTNGAVVIVRPAGGEILALASAPDFDPNDFAAGLSVAAWRVLLHDERHPLINRAVSGTFAPGSIFKPVVALAALASGKAQPGLRFDCPGSFQLGTTRFRCWLPVGHGTLNLRQALEHSCNVYFFQLGLRCGPDAIGAMAAALGLGRRTGIELDHEAAGLLPDRAWKRRVYGDAWRDGDTCNLSIGQGFLAVTPLQMAMVAAALANGGRLYRPRLVAEVRAPDGTPVTNFPPRLVQALAWDAPALRVVREGMLDVVNSAEGSGRLAAVPGLRVAGKTGTAEYGRKQDGHKLGWMIAFAPFEDPRYAVAFMVEDAVSGGTTVAPRMRVLMQELFKPAPGAPGEG